jgi:arsenate reductase
MAEGLASDLLPAGVAVFSAGSRPTTVNPRAIESLKEIGIDIAAYRSKSVDEIPAGEVDFVITLCQEGEEDCPFFPGDVQRLHWPLPDPAAVEGNDEQIMASFRAVRDELSTRLRELTVDSR